jgi:hypothetical protein
LADVLNALYHAGAPGPQLRGAGVVLRLFDALSDGTHHWLSGGSVYMGSDRFSASVINARQPALYNYIDGGFVWDADAVQACLMCAYPSDGHSAWRRCKPPYPPGRSKECLPGCPSPGTTGGWSWCNAAPSPESVRGCEKGCPNGCAFAPEQLGDMLLTWEHSDGTTRGYSELIVDSECLVKSEYPHAILGVFYQAAGNAVHRHGYETINGDVKTAEAEARRTRAAFAEAYGLSARAVPLLRLDLDRAAAPFGLDEADAT